MKLVPRKFSSSLVAAVIAIGFLAGGALSPVGGPPIAIAQSKKAAPPVKTIDHGYVYVMRGLANIWSRGMDELAKKLEARGVRVHLANHRHWKDFAAEAAEKYQSDPNFRPIIIIGHSLGANAGVLMAAKLSQARVPVRLLITFDGLAHTAAATGKIAINVQEVLNFYNSRLLGMEMVPGRGFRGTIENIDVKGVKGAGHIKLDKNPELQAQAIALVMKALGEK